MSNPLGIEPADVFLAKNTKPPQWLWDKQLALGCISLLVGQPKAGKSTFVKNLIRAISSGTKFLDRATLKTGVLYFAFEEHEAMLQENLIALGITSQSVHIKTGILTKGEDDIFAHVELYCQEYGIQFIVIDPLIYFSSIDDTNDYSKVYNKMGKIKKLAKQLNAHILIVHHSNKSTSDSSRQILGSNAFFGSCDGALLLSRNKENLGSIKSELRYGNSIFDPVCFRYDQNGILIFEGSFKETKLKAIPEKILIELSSDSITFETLRDTLKISDSDLNSQLGVLIEQGIVIRSGRGVRGEPFMYSLPNIETVATEEIVRGSL